MTTAPPRITFPAFVTSLFASALHHMGRIPDAEENAQDLPLARQTIDLLAMLQSKTQGNLDEEEEKHLAAILHELRLRYLEATQDGTEAASQAEE